MNGVSKESKAKSVKTLNQFSPGTKGKVVKISSLCPVRRRMMDMGIVPGAEILIEGVAPMGDPIKVKVRGYNLTLRKNEAVNVFVEVICYD